MEEIKKEEEKPRTLTAKLEGQKKKTHHNQEQLSQLEEEQLQEEAQNFEQSEQRVDSAERNKMWAKQKAVAEKEAFEKIKEATMAGIKKGEEASKQLHLDAKKQSEEETELAVLKLKTKFDSTKKQVMQIVSNFGRIHSDLEELKQEYI
mmetsp:Transcript_2200/g.3298  ORF Transcript_2200/g.3298 Transcript_2200/m.3298 type:complete len:149 (+) Transcript_2200:4404-4850(+)